MAQTFGVPTLAIVGCVAWLVIKLIRIGQRDKTLPPGPPTVPLLGNIHLLPTKYSFVKFTEWAREYGGIISVRTMLA
ncbi:Cytochrome P450 monooxygenase [Psilocybe cubensis]|uniref:Cytochrome P450 monooxygenase n=2 Tax=Psilocybe cubensis TaxID=181762 RepID=A0ACB8GL05_PSICU|nr:Cytochrome P450 monooxygenase [Psilocybe cubensis]KAH9476425.1 Cytochrome P450 monooxygenase [Psilocybe cubensis]